MPAVIHFLGTASIVGSAVQAAADWIADAEADDVLLEQLLEELGQNEPRQWYRRALESERAFTVENLNLMGVVFSGTSLLNFFESEMEQIESEAHEFEEWNPGLTEKAGTAWFTGLAPAIRQARNTAYRMESQQRALKILVALKRNCQPSELDPAQIDADQLADWNVARESTIDTYTNELMKIRVIGDTIAIYSLGPDLKDNGGNMALDFGILTHWR